LLGAKADVTLFQELLQQTEAVDPRLRAWPARYPIRALELRDEWQRLLATAEWIRDCPDPGAFYMRQIDSPGVDTKFIESHRKTVSGLLDLVLPADRVDASKPVSRFADRYGFKTKPEYVRLRVRCWATELTGSPSLIRRRRNWKVLLRRRRVSTRTSSTAGGGPQSDWSRIGSASPASPRPSKRSTTADFSIYLFVRAVPSVAGGGAIQTVCYPEEYFAS
jgi:hypothetical protein